MRSVGYGSNELCVFYYSERVGEMGAKFSIEIGIIITIGIVITAITFDTHLLIRSFFFYFAES